MTTRSGRPTPPFIAIIPWAGTIADIPSGFYLCDGTNGTPDLRDLFLAAKLYGFSNGGSADFADRSHWHLLSPVASSGGHTHLTSTALTTTLVTDAGFYAEPGAIVGVGEDHTHDITLPLLDTPSGAHGHYLASGANVSTNISSDTNVDIRPPYYALAYIQGDVGNAPVGSIVNYAGTLAGIPTNWTPCDGTSGTPNLSANNTFIVGAGASYLVLAQGGAYYVYSGSYPSNIDHDHGVGSLAIADENAHQHPWEFGKSNTYPNTVTAETSLIGLASGLVGSNHDHSVNVVYTDTPNAGHGHSTPAPVTRAGTIGMTSSSTFPNFAYIGFLMRVS